MHDLKARIGDRIGPLGGVGDGVGVAIERDQTGLRPQLRENQARVTAAAKGGIDVDALRVRAHGRIPQSLNGLVQQDSAVLQRWWQLWHRVRR